MISSPKPSSRYLSLARFIILVVPLVLFGGLVYRDLVVSGVLEASYQMSRPSPFISVLRPQSRVSEVARDASQNTFQTIQDEPIYFDIRLPRHFMQAEVMLEFKNLDQAVFEAGAMVNKEAWTFHLVPVENSALDFLIQDKLRWSQLREGNTVLFQKKQKYKTLGEFLASPPPQPQIATYNYPLKTNFHLSGYVPQSGGIDVAKTLRGSHRMYTYVKNEPLDFTFYVQDVNRHVDDDYLSLDIYHNDELVHSQFEKIDNNTSDNFVFSETKPVHVLLPDLPEGTYRIDLVTPSDDIFIRRIISSQDYLVFIDKVYLGDNVGFNDEFHDSRLAVTHLYTNASTIAAETTHIEGLQTLSFEDQVIDLTETHRRYFATSDFGVNEIIIPRNDVLLETKGVFSFSRANFFNPQLKSLSDGRPFDTDTINYVIADYTPAEALADGWKRATLHFNLADYYTQDDELHMILSVPYLEKENQGIMIRKISAKLSAKPLSWHELASYVKHFFYGS